MGDIDGMIHDEMTHDEILHDYAAAEMDDVADSDRHDSDVDGEVDSDRHASDGDGVAAVLFDSGNNI